MTLNELTASKIKELRVKSNKSAEEVAKDLGLAKSNYSRLENGKTEITLTKIESLSKIFNLPIQAFLPSVTNSTINVSNGDNSTINNTQINNYTDPTQTETITKTIELLQNILSNLHGSK